MKHWFSCDTIHLIYKKRRMYQRLQKFQRFRHSPPPGLLAAYRKLSNRVCFLTRLDSRNYAESLSKQYSSNPKKFWNWLNSSKGKRDSIPLLRHDDVPILEDSAKQIFSTNIFSQFLRKRMFLTFLSFVSH